MDPTDAERPAGLLLPYRNSKTQEMERNFGTEPTCTRKWSIVLKRTWAGEVRNVSMPVAVGVSATGGREILEVTEGAKEDKAGWSGFLKHLKGRGLQGIKLVVTDSCMGLVEPVREFYPEAKRQRCSVYFYRNIFSVVPKAKMKEVTMILKAIHASENLEATHAKANAVIEKLRKLRLNQAADMVQESITDTLNCLQFSQSSPAKDTNKQPA